MQNIQSDICVIGGGPGGSTAAILLAKEGFKVTLIEKDQFPRYHIGESGILSLPLILDLLGVKQKVEAFGFKKKGGVFFDWHQKWIINWNATNDYTYHLKREDFDHLLLEHAKEVGVEVFEKTKVEEINFENNEPKSLIAATKSTKLEFTFKYLIDASGRAAILARKYLKSQHFLDSFRNIALWSYWDNAMDPNLLSDFKELDDRFVGEYVQDPITLSSIEDGWIWGIPLHDHTMSVGVVHYQKTYDEKKKKGLKKEDIYKASLKESKVFTELLSKSTQKKDLRFESDWSYATDIWAKKGFFIVGDAAVFIDPLLSTGMTSAMLSSLNAAACITSILKNEIDEEKAIAFYSEEYRKRFWRYSFVISSLYSAKVTKENLFQNTHLLTSNDVDEKSLKELKTSFSRVISGLEDLRELSAPNLQKIVGDRLRDNFKGFLDLFPQTFDDDPCNMEVVYSPRLGVREKADLSP